jgi:hypothetical protein
LQEEVKGSG